VLIGIAVVLGIALLQVVDNTPSASSASDTTTTTLGSGTTDTTGKPAKPRSEITVQVLNGSGVSGAAQQKTNDLKTAGYATVAPGDAAKQAGNTLACKPELITDQYFLGIELANLGVRTTPMAWPTAQTAPAGAKIGEIDCLVVLGT
jgi:hypothetical protein